MDYEYLRVERDGDVAIVHVDRPPVNALDPSLLAEGAAILDELRGDPPPAVVIAGREGCFCAGADLKLVPTLDADGQRQMVDGINRLFAGWYSFERPLVTAVTGHAIAGGFILALCGDVRVGVHARQARLDRGARRAFPIRSPRWQWCAPSFRRRPRASSCSAAS